MKKAKPKIIFLLLTFGLLLSACLSNETSNIPAPETAPAKQDTKTPSEALDENNTSEPAAENTTDTTKYDELEIVTLLPPDGIPAIDNPVFLPADEADQEYAPDEQVIGVVFNGEARAYSINLLSGHEIVNDEVGGIKIAVTW